MPRFQCSKKIGVLMNYDQPINKNKNFFSYNEKPRTKQMFKNVLSEENSTRRKCFASPHVVWKTLIFLSERKIVQPKAQWHSLCSIYMLLRSNKFTHFCSSLNLRMFQEQKKSIFSFVSLLCVVKRFFAQFSVRLIVIKNLSRICEKKQKSKACNKNKQ